MRFGGIKRLYGTAGFERLRRARVCVIGIGGVGSWVAESLARSAVGSLTLVDLDDVCVSNVNRQVHAVSGEIGRPKVEVMGRRCQAIHPECAIEARQEFFLPETSESLLRDGFDYVVDAIDSGLHKALLIALCTARGMRIITVGGAGGRRDPSRARVADLAESTHDRLLVKVRKELRAQHGFPERPKKFDVEAVFSTEPLVYPSSDGSVCEAKEEGAELRLDCESGFGTASFVTGTFGLLAAARVVQGLAMESVACASANATMRSHNF